MPTSETHHTYYAQTMPGFEKIAWIEIRQRLASPKFLNYLFAKDQNGIVMFQAASAPADLLRLRTTEDVFLCAMTLADLSRGWRDLRQIGQAVKESRSLDQAIQVYRDFKRQRKGKMTYRVVSRLLGKHQYRRKDLQEAFVRAVNERYARALPQVEEDADLEIWVNLLGSDLLCGLRLSDESMRHRAYQAVHLPASLRPSAAAAMVLLTEPGADDVFVDPMCGSGTLLVERAYAGPSRRALGGDIAPRHAWAAATNLAMVAPETAVHVWDARRLPLQSASVDRLATNLPFGKQIASREEVERLYPPFFAEMERILKPGGKAVVLSSEYELVKEAVRACPRLHIATGYSVAVLGQWGRIYVIDREKNR